MHLPTWSLDPCTCLPGAQTRAPAPLWPPRSLGRGPYGQTQVQRDAADAIRASWNWRELAKIVEERPTAMDAANVTQIMFKVRKLVTVIIIIVSSSSSPAA